MRPRTQWHRWCRYGAPDGVVGYPPGQRRWRRRCRRQGRTGSPLNPWYCTGTAWVRGGRSGKGRGIPSRARRRASGVTAGVSPGGTGLVVRPIRWRLLPSGVRSVRSDGAYDSAAEGNLPAAVGKKTEPGEFPARVLGGIRQHASRYVTRCPARHVQDLVVILGHHLLLCASSRKIQVVSGTTAGERRSSWEREQSGRTRPLQG